MDTIISVLKSMGFGASIRNAIIVGVASGLLLQYMRDRAEAVDVRVTRDEQQDQRQYDEVSSVLTRIDAKIDALQRDLLMVTQRRQ